MIALDSDKFVGLSAISYSAEEQIGYVMIGGVDAAYHNCNHTQGQKHDRGVGLKVSSFVTIQLLAGS
ncbi:MAG: hypothetical protein ACOYNY_21215 [Caldilineaceae bacterium]